MANCLSDIAKEIIADCTTQGAGGNEIKGWLGNRLNFSFTYDTTNSSKVTGITAATGKRLWPVMVSKKGLNSGFDRVKEAGRGDRFTHFGGFTVTEFDAASVENVDSLDDLILIVESKDKADVGDGTFRGFGFKAGLTVTSDTMRANDAYGSRPLELGSAEGDTEPWSQYTVLITDYAGTKTALVALETPAT